MLTGTITLPEAVGPDMSNVVISPFGLRTKPRRCTPRSFSSPLGNEKEPIATT
jgi:hypothetical protein